MTDDPSSACAAGAAASFRMQGALLAIHSARRTAFRDRCTTVHLFVSFAVPLLAVSSIKPTAFNSWIHRVRACTHREHVPPPPPCRPGVSLVAACRLTRARLLLTNKLCHNGLISGRCANGNSQGPLCSPWTSYAAFAARGYVN